MGPGNHKRSIIFITSLLLIGMLIYSTANVFAQTKQEQTCLKKSPSDAAIKNYLKGLNSDNDGLRKSCIYYAGKYKINEAVDLLKEQLSKEEDQETSLLLVMALYQILEKNALSDIDEESKVNSKFATIYE